LHLLLAPLRLKRMQFVEFALERALQTSFLRREVAEVTLVCAEWCEPESMLGGPEAVLPERDPGTRPGRERRGWFRAPKQWIETPAGISEQLDQRGFFFANRIEALHESLTVRFVSSGIFARQQDGAASETGLEGIE
jgi:hypothetical protein